MSRSVLPMIVALVVWAVLASSFVALWGWRWRPAAKRLVGGADAHILSAGALLWPIRLMVLAQLTTVAAYWGWMGAPVVDLVLMLAWAAGAALVAVALVQLEAAHRRTRHGGNTGTSGERTRL